MPTGSLCPVCGRLYCDHTLAQRGQTEEEAYDRDLTEEEKRAFYRNDSEQKLSLAQANRKMKPGKEKKKSTQ